MAKELNRRTRDVLAIMQAIVRQTPRQDIDTYANAVSGRLTALSRAHTLLADTHWGAVDLQVLLTAAAGTQNGRASMMRINLRGPRVKVRADAVQSFVTVIHELSANAAQHGALSANGGLVRVVWLRDAEAGKVRLRWAESGGPEPVEVAPRTSFGCRVVNATVKGPLRSTIAWIWKPEGLVVEMSMPCGEGELQPLI